MKIVSYISSIKAGKRYNGGNPITAALESIVSAANNSGGEFTAYKHEGTHTVSCDVGFAFGSYTQRKLDTERAVLIRGIEAAKQPCYFLDSAAFSTHIRNALNSSETQMFRVGLNSCTGQGIFWNQDLPKERYEAFKKQFTEQRDPNFSIRMSGIGKPLCQLQMEKQNKTSEPPPYNFKMRVLFGDLIEAAAIGIMKAAGIKIQSEQKEVHNEIAGVKIDLP